MARKSFKNLIQLVDDAVEGDISVEQLFLNDLNHSIQITEEKNTRKPSQTYKPSGMNCMRQSYYQIIGIDMDNEVVDVKLTGICESGTDRHERIQKAVSEMKENGLDCEYLDVAEFVKERNLDYLDIVAQQGMETKLFHKVLNISFLCDGIIKYRDAYYILEIKTESSFKFNSRTDVNPEHYNQATAYSIAFNLDDVLFLYENRDTCDKKVFLFHVTDDMKHNLVSYIEQVDDYVKKLTPPPIPDDTKVCRYCKYRRQCSSDR